MRVRGSQGSRRSRVTSWFACSRNGEARACALDFAPSSLPGSPLAERRGHRSRTACDIVTSLVAAHEVHGPQRGVCSSIHFALPCVLVAPWFAAREMQKPQRGVRSTFRSAEATARECTSRRVGTRSLRGTVLVDPRSDRSRELPSAPGACSTLQMNCSARLEPPEPLGEWPGDRSAMPLPHHALDLHAARRAARQHRRHGEGRRPRRQHHPRQREREHAQAAASCGALSVSFRGVVNTRAARSSSFCGFASSHSMQRSRPWPRRSLSSE